MTILKQRELEGTVGSAVTTAAGFDVVTGTVTYAANGYSGTCAQIPAGTNFVQDNSAPGFIGFYIRFQALPSAEVCINRVTSSTGTSVCAATVNPTGTISLWSGLSSKVSTSTASIPANTWCRIESSITSTLQTVRLFTNPATNDVSEEVSGAANGNVPGKYLYGIGWAAHSSDPYQLDTIVSADDWPNMGVAAPTGPQRYINLAGVQTPVLRYINLGGVKTAVSESTNQEVPAQITLPATLPLTFGVS